MLRDVLSGQRSEPSAVTRRAFARSAAADVERALTAQGGAAQRPDGDLMVDASSRQLVQLPTDQVDGLERVVIPTFGKTIRWPVHTAGSGSRTVCGVMRSGASLPPSTLGIALCVPQSSIALFQLQDTATWSSTRADGQPPRTRDIWAPASRSRRS